MVKHWVNNKTKTDIIGTEPLCSVFLQNKKTWSKSDLYVLITLAPEGTFLKLFDNLYTELKEKEDIINSFVAQLKYTAKFDEKLRERFFPNENSLVNSDSIYQY